MKLRRALVGAALAALLVGVAGPGPGAYAQAPQPSAKPARPLPPGHPPTETGLPAGHPAVGQPAPGGGLPPGHPSVSDSEAAGGDGQEMPPGHPSVEQGMPPGHPGVGSPRTDAQGFFQPPDDGAADDPTLPVGTIVVHILDAEDRPLNRAPVTMGILKNSVAKGESRSQIARETNDMGEVRFDGLEVGSGISYRVTTTRGPGFYAVMPFSLSDKAGKQVVLHAYEATTDVNQALIGAQGIVYLAMREGSMSIDNLVNFFNVGPVTWVPSGVVVQLPEGFKAFSKPDSMDDTRFEEVSGKGAELRGSIEPGQASTTFRYQVPLSGDAQQTFRIQMPPHMAQARVMVEATKEMSVDVAGFPAAQKTTNRDGKRVLVTEKTAQRSEGGIRFLEITVSGLPTPSPTRWFAAGLGIAILAAGIAYAANKPKDGLLDKDLAADLQDAREALLDEIVALEKARQAGEIGPKTYARIRAALIEALDRIVGQLDVVKPVTAKKKPTKRATAA